MTPSRPDDPDPDGRPPEVVVLLAEVQAGGHIYEIGSRARVLRATPDELTLELGSERTVASCPRSFARDATDGGGARDRRRGLLRAPSLPGRRGDGHHATPSPA